MPDAVLASLRGTQVKRRIFVTGVVGTLLAAPRGAAAQGAGRMPRVGYLFSFTPPVGQHLWEGPTMSRECRRGR